MHNSQQEPSHQLECSHTMYHYIMVTLHVQGCLIVQNMASTSSGKCWTYISTNHGIINMIYKTSIYNNFAYKFQADTYISELSIKIASTKNITSITRYQEDGMNRMQENILHQCFFIDIVESYPETTFLYYQMALSITDESFHNFQLNENNTLVVSSAQLGSLLVKWCALCRNTYRFVMSPNISNMQGKRCRGHLFMSSAPKCANNYLRKLSLIHQAAKDDELSLLLKYPVKYLLLPNHIEHLIQLSLALVFETRRYDTKEHCDIELDYRLIYADVPLQLEQPCDVIVSHYWLCKYKHISQYFLQETYWHLLKFNYTV